MSNPVDVHSIGGIANLVVHYLRLLRHDIAPSLLSLFYLLCIGSVFFDVIHHMLHRCNKSSHPLFQRLARAHHFHHLYFTRHMNFDERYLRQNQLQALPLELAAQIVGSALGYIFASFVTPNGLVWCIRNHLWFTIGFQILRTSFVILTSGRDSNHLIYKTAPKDRNWILVGPEFHALHHVYPDRYISSFIKVFDWIWGTAYSFRRKRFTVTEGSGAFIQAIITDLERKEGVACISKLKFGTDWDHHHFEKVIAVLSNSDVLILAHGCHGEDAVGSNCDSATQLIKLFKQYRATNPACPTLPEVWYVGSEIEFHSSWTNVRLQGCSQSKRRTFLPHARSFFDDPDIIYRHIVLPSFPSSMVTAGLSADWAARCAMWWIRRGARYIPVTYTGIACLDYFKFMYGVPYANDADQM
ncbi:unnamed protein product [Penicillium egyptiacum]|uniref:Fatty acid hydroxylase domain-containing protein n=1 Tax=Penicillium egyptiacum TaxID=1303716 RepID=A0A9W4KMJ4_9EURO|nr:unnamed protein product [Penicillium egyptiacum]